MQCVFDTPFRREGNTTLNQTGMMASFISPSLVTCDSPPYALRLGERAIYINTTYNTSLFECGPTISRDLP